MDAQFEVDLDNEKVLVEGEWLGCQELAEKIRRMIDSQDYKIGLIGASLEHLQQALSNARKIELKLTEDDAGLLERHAEKAGIHVSAFARQAVQAYLAAQVPLAGKSNSSFSTITTEPVEPGQATKPVELTTRKNNSTKK